MAKSRLRKLTDTDREGSFAGFKSPRYLAILPKGTVEERKNRYKNTGGYFHFHEDCKNTTEYGFYLNSDFMPCPRWKYTPKGIKYYADQFEDSTVQGLIFLLSHGRYLAGCSFGEEMSGFCERKIFTDEDDCARYSDEIARIYAEKCYDESLISNSDQEN